MLHPVSLSCIFFSSSATVGDDITAQASSPDDPITAETSPCDNDFPAGDGIRIPETTVILLSGMSPILRQ